MDCTVVDTDQGCEDESVSQSKSHNSWFPHKRCSSQKLAHGDQVRLGRRKTLQHVHSTRNCHHFCDHSKSSLKHIITEIYRVQFDLRSRQLDQSNSKLVRSTQSSNSLNSAPLPTRYNKTSSCLAAAAKGLTGISKHC
ncbi:hypothetical protein BaRGS_00029122 [Batillaria attramentaria]|uniref:Uncharacterized protein n=1 Tax=Batillaria attramentaria TaxID=370345 RepID=A0ABD0JYE5_9CAEN